MTKPNFTFKIAVLFVLCFAGLTASFAQPDAKAQAEPSYEVILQVLVGSNEAGQKANTPANLAAVTKKINNNFAFSNYRLSNTYIGRVANTGSIEYKSVSNGFGQTEAQDTPVFLEWSIISLKNMPNARGQNTVQIQPFRFGARVPVKTANLVNDKINSIVNYESIGLSLQKISLPENDPTLIGTLPTTKNGETIFLVLTVKPVDE
jgi:hypothetical protein